MANLPEPKTPGTTNGQAGQQGLSDTGVCFLVQSKDKVVEGLLSAPLAEDVIPASACWQITAVVAVATPSRPAGSCNCRQHPQLLAQSACKKQNRLFLTKSPQDNDSRFFSSGGGRP